MPLPKGERVKDGEWVLVVFEVGRRSRSTAAAARGLDRGPRVTPVLSFEKRDWERLVEFAEATDVRPTVASPATVPGDSPTEPNLPDFDPGSSTRVARLPESSAAGETVPGACARVLLVDDDRDVCDVVGAMLDAVGLSVESAASGEEALERVDCGNYDLLVLDWNLPGMTGVEVCRVIRKNRSTCSLPVLFLTAHASSRDIVEAFECGADDYVVKPFRAPELGARIFSLLRRARTATASP